ncbi:MAG TPA: hypothetical protein VK206_15305 [Anaerolineales bacterium]|nr:hypothetical protein [Anaerolineales bacterium]
MSRRRHPAIDARLDLALEERLVVPPMPRHIVTDQRDGATGLGAGRVDPQVPQPQERKETGPFRIVRVAAPAAIGFLAREQLRTPTFCRHLRTLGRDSLVGRIGQVLHHLPADRRVRIKQPLYDRSLWLRGLPFGYISCHLLVLLISKIRCWWPNDLRCPSCSPRGCSSRVGLVISTRLRQSIRRGGTGVQRFDGTRLRYENCLPTRRLGPFWRLPTLWH